MVADVSLIFSERNLPKKQMITLEVVATIFENGASFWMMINPYGKKKTVKLVNQRSTSR